MLGRLFGKSEPKELAFEGDGTFSQEIVGESFYQEALASIAGSKNAERKEYYCSAVLVCETNNPHDKNAVAVTISGKKVGHLSREDALAFRRAMKKSRPDLPNVRVDAVIVGGWKDDESEGHYGVELDIA